MFFNKLLKPAVLTIACAAALTAGSFGNVSFFHEAHAQTSQLSGLPDFTKLVEDNGKAVVSISTVKKAKRLDRKTACLTSSLKCSAVSVFLSPSGISTARVDTRTPRPGFRLHHRS